MCIKYQGSRMTLVKLGKHKVQLVHRSIQWIGPCHSFGTASNIRLYPPITALVRRKHYPKDKQWSAFRAQEQHNNDATLMCNAAALKMQQCSDKSRIFSAWTNEFKHSGSVGQTPGWNVTYRKFLCRTQSLHSVSSHTDSLYLSGWNGPGILVQYQYIWWYLFVFFRKSKKEQVREREQDITHISTNLLV